MLMLLSRNRAWFLASIAVIAISGTAGSLAPASGMDLPEEVAQALKWNETALTPLTVSWEQTRSSHLPLEQLLRHIRRPNDKAFFHPQYVTLTYQDGKLWLESKKTQWRKNRFHEGKSAIAFDGKALYGSNLREARPVVSIRDADFLKTHCPECYVFYAEYLEAAGFEVHNRNATIHEPPNSRLLHVLDKGSKVSDIRKVTLDSNSCLRIEVTTADGRQAFLLDPAMQYAARKIEKYNRNGDLTQTTVNDHFTELSSPHVWLPKQCRVSDYTWGTIPETVSEQPIVLTSIIVKELSQEVWPLERFVIDYSKPGTLVGDSRKEAAEMSEAFLDDDGMYKYQNTPTPEDLAYTVALSRSRSRTVLVMVSVLLIVLLAGVVIFRQYRRRQALRL